MNPNDRVAVSTDGDRQDTARHADRKFCEAGAPFTCDDGPVRLHFGNDLVADHDVGRCHMALPLLATATLPCYLFQDAGHTELREAFA